MADAFDNLGSPSSAYDPELAARQKALTDVLFGPPPAQEPLPTTAPLSTIKGGDKASVLLSALGDILNARQNYGNRNSYQTRPVPVGYTPQALDRIVAGRREATAQRNQNAATTDELNRKRAEFGLTNLERDQAKRDEIARRARDQAGENARRAAEHTQAVADREAADLRNYQQQYSEVPGIEKATTASEAIQMVRPYLAKLDANKRAQAQSDIAAEDARIRSRQHDQELSTLQDQIASYGFNTAGITDLPTARAKYAEIAKNDPNHKQQETLLSQAKQSVLAGKRNPGAHPVYGDITKGTITDVKAMILEDADALGLDKAHQIELSNFIDDKLGPIFQKPPAPAPAPDMFGIKGGRVVGLPLG